MTKLKFAETRLKAHGWELKDLAWPQAQCNEELRRGEGPELRAYRGLVVFCPLSLMLAFANRGPKMGQKNSTSCTNKYRLFLKAHRLKAWSPGQHTIGRWRDFSEVGSTKRCLVMGVCPWSCTSNCGPFLFFKPQIWGELLCSITNSLQRYLPCLF